MAHIFLDESGQFTKRNNEEYFIVGSFTIGEPWRIEKKFKKWQHDKYPKKMRHQPEIKFSNPYISDRLRIKTLDFISRLDVRIRYAYLKKGNIPDDYIKKGKLKSGLLYTNIIGETIEMYLPTGDKELRVFCDERHLKGIKRSEFKDILKARLLPQLPQGSIIQIEMINSASNKNIQIADWISGAIAWELERKNLGKECYEKLKNNILNDGKELFKDYWENRFVKQKHQSCD